MTIFEINQRYRISMKKLREMDKAGVLKVRPSNDPIGDGIRAGRKHDRTITVEQYLHLVRHPRLVDEMELEWYMQRLGNYTAEAAPWVTVGARISLAAHKDKVAIETVATWVRQFLERQPIGFKCGHHHLGVRLAYNAPENSRSYVCKKLQSCLWHCRASGTLAGFSRLENGRSIYLRPERAEYDL